MMAPDSKASSSSGSVQSNSPAANAMARRAQALAPGLRRRMMNAAQGLTGVISLSRGDPDQETPLHIIEAGQRALSSGWTHYTSWLGIPDLRDAIAAKLERDNGLVADPDREILVTAGAQAALYVAIQTLLEEGDEVLLPDPHYSAYEGAIATSGAIAKLVPSQGETGFRVTVAELERALTPRTKVLVLVDPSNPGGDVLPSADVHDIADFVVRHNLVVLSDEVYEKLLFDGNVHTSIGALPRMQERTVSLYSFSKSYAMTGWRIGYMVGPADFMERASELHSVISICASASAQVAALEALQGPQDNITAMNATYLERRNYMVEALGALGLPCVIPRGGFTLMIDIRSTGMSSVDFCLYLLRQAKVHVFPGAMYGPSGEGYARMTLLAPLARLREAAERIALALPVPH